MKILIVEDSPTLRALLWETLRELFPEAAIHADAGTGFQRQNRLEHAATYDLITMDGKLPGQYGPALVRQLRECGCTGVIIMVTTAQSAIRDGIHAGATAGCNKEDLEQLPKLLHELGLR